jgi:hypothetical protein
MCVFNPRAHRADQPSGLAGFASVEFGLPDDFAPGQATAFRPCQTTSPAASRLSSQRCAHPALYHVLGQSLGSPADTQGRPERGLLGPAQ